MQLILFSGMTELCSMAGCNREVPSPAFYSGGVSAASGGRLPDLICNVYHTVERCM